ncbi:MAG: hypothetical protein ACYCQK_07765 [Acidiferrobacteraceae bacterium]
MSFYSKLAIFWVIVGATLWLVSRHRNSRLSRFALSWHGPLPIAGELKSRYLFRWFLYAMRWFIQISFFLAVGYGIAWRQPQWAKTEMFLMFWAFALPLFAGMALLGGALALFGSVKAKWFGPNPTQTGHEHEM